MKAKTILTIVLFFGIFVQMNAQSDPQKKQSFPIHISVMDVSSSLPNFWFLRYSYNPAGMIGTEYLLKEKNNHDFHLTGNLGFYHQEDWQTGTFLNSEFGYRQHLNRWNIYARLGAGYVHTFAPRPVYQFEGGQFQEVKDNGRSYFMGSVSLNVSYELSKKENSPEIYFTFMQSVELPFNRWAGAHQLVGLGYKFYPFK